MAEIFSISANVLKKLENHVSSDKEVFCGVLFGLRVDGEAIVCIHYSFEESSPSLFLSQFDDAASYMVEGMEGIGFFIQSPQASMHASMLNMCLKFFPPSPHQQACFNGRDILIMSLDKSETKKHYFYKFNPSSRDLISIDVVEADDEHVKRIRDKFTLLHLQAKIPISIVHSSNFDDKQISIQHTINQLANELANHQSIFKLPRKKNSKSKNKFIIVKNTYKHKEDYDDFIMEDDIGNNDEGRADDDGGDGDVGEVVAVKMADIYDELELEMVNLESYKQKTVCVDLLRQRTGKEAKTYFSTSSPVIFHDNLNLMVVSLTLPLNVAVLVANDDSTIPLCTHIVKAINKQLKDVATLLNDFSRSSVYYIPKPYHYCMLDSLLTVLYPEGVEERQLKETRKDLHERFLIPLSSPFFKRSKHHPITNHHTNTYLLDVHEGLPPSKVRGRVTLVKGSYEYRHYMQDKFNDDGWGCAYRSLQTIASWLNLQGFTEKSVPTHLQIQQALVEVADKPPSFLNSKKWIGSAEVSYVLDHIYNVQCRICHVSSGDEMDSKVRELIHHFESEGSPIMIGGGVLAHTIIGVDFNEVTGEVAYLILDPHYTGSEDLKTIQEKGWCGWKSGDFWKKGSFYNMCMPLKPATY